MHGRYVYFYSWLNVWVCSCCDSLTKISESEMFDMKFIMLSCIYLSAAVTQYVVINSEAVIRQFSSVSRDSWCGLVSLAAVQCFWHPNSKYHLVPQFTSHWYVNFNAVCILLSTLGTWCTISNLLWVLKNYVMPAAISTNLLAGESLVLSQVPWVVPLSCGEQGKFALW